MDIVEQKAREYADNEVRRYHKHSGIIEKYGMERARALSEHEAWELEEAYEAGWQAAMEYLYTLPMDKALMQILEEVDNNKTK